MGSRTHRERGSHSATKSSATHRQFGEGFATGNHLRERLSEFHRGEPVAGSRFQPRSECHGRDGRLPRNKYSTVAAIGPRVYRGEHLTFALRLGEAKARFSVVCPMV